jgi:hypothetical protein
MAIGRNASASYARVAQGQFGQLRASLRAAQDSLDNLHRSLNLPVIRQRRGTIPGSRSDPSSLLSAGISSFGKLFTDHVIVGGLLSDFVDTGRGQNSSQDQLSHDFAQSSTQFAGKLLDSMLRGQRIR